ncbi:MAG: type I-C CRISPR-associated protein Cas8c/Csd1 [Clostridiales bacterium]|jgi:CRISPR-associated protein Csd1|nr:type I-C CRISPR-associated protein Cas8c/Csd1 [Clostridiales bacterium]
MSIFSSLLETYNKCESNATGIKVYSIDKKTGDKVVDDNKMFLPLFHSTFKATIFVKLNQHGELLSVERKSNEETIVIPVTEESTGRTGSPAAHPLCDQLAYVDKDLSLHTEYKNNKKIVDSTKYDLYINQLDSWKGDNIKLNAVYTYLSQNSIIQDLMDNGEFSNPKEYIPNSSKLDVEVVGKLGVAFSVQVPDDMQPNVWDDKELYQLWIQYQSKVEVNDIEGFDYLDGSNLVKVVKIYPKKINNIVANAKLLSCNDMVGFTYRGRFEEQNHAILVDATVCQKLHIALRWLISNYGLATDTQSIVVWAIGSDSKQDIQPYGNSYDIFEDFSSINTDIDKLSNVAREIDNNYSRKVSKVLRGFGSASSIKQHNRKIAIAIFDAATTGRMGITFYQEFPESEYLESIAKWHEETSWHLTKFIKDDTKSSKKDKGKSKVVHYVGCPSFRDILETVYGKGSGGKDEGYTKLKKKIQKQLLECMFGNFSFPESLVKMAAHRVSNPMHFENGWEQALNIACALIRKYIRQSKGEYIQLELEKQRNDRDYLYGRLLSIANKIESHALYKADKTSERSTNAIRLMSSFAVKPFSTWGLLWQQLQPYINQLQGASWYQMQIDEIMSLFQNGEFENNQPLSPLYLLGYSVQNRDLNKNNKEENTSDDNTN